MGTSRELVACWLLAELDELCLEIAGFVYANQVKGTGEMLINSLDLHGKGDVAIVKKLNGCFEQTAVAWLRVFSIPVNRWGWRWSWLPGQSRQWQRMLAGAEGRSL